MHQMERAPPLTTTEPSERTHVPLETQRESNATRRQLQHEDDCLVEGFRPLLPNGASFEARFVDYQTLFIFATGKCVWEFEIVEPGEFMGLRIIRPFRVAKLLGRPGKRGKFKLHAGGDMYQTLVRLLDYKQRKDRISLQPLRHMLFRIRVRTVKTNHRQEQLAEHQHYSVVDQISVSS